MSSRAVETSDPEYVPSGFHHPDKRRVGGLGRGTEGGQQKTAEAAEMIGRVFVKRTTQADALVTAASSISAMRKAKPATARSRIQQPAKGRRKVGVSERAVGPTEERLAKGDVVIVGGVHRGAPPIEKLRKDLDNDEKTSIGIFNAAAKLKRHYDGSVNGVRSLDTPELDGLGGGYSDLTGEEGWVHHYDEFTKARRLLGHYPDRPHHGCAGVVIAVVCEERPLRDAAAAHLPSQRTDRAQAVVLDRLRSGLLTLAYHWKFL